MPSAHRRFFYSKKGAVGGRSLLCKEERQTLSFGITRLVNTNK
jgi:hypothetical protein